MQEDSPNTRHRRLNDNGLGRRSSPLIVIDEVRLRFSRDGNNNGFRLTAELLGPDTNSKVWVPQELLDMIGAHVQAGRDVLLSCKLDSHDSTQSGPFWEINDIMASTEEWLFEVHPSPRAGRGRDHGN